MMKFNQKNVINSMQISIENDDKFQSKNTINSMKILMQITINSNLKWYKLSQNYNRII